MKIPKTERNEPEQDLEAQPKETAVDPVQGSLDNEEDEHQHYSQRAPWLRAGSILGSR